MTIDTEYGGHVRSASGGDWWIKLDADFYENGIVLNFRYRQLFGEGRFTIRIGGTKASLYGQQFQMKESQ